jgi:Flp pilus assembly secretin CpaC
LQLAWKPHPFALRRHKEDDPMKSLKASSLAFAAALTAAALTTPALAESSITVAADRAKVVNIAGTPAAVIIGNPTFADVTVREGKIIVHGRHFGSTNLLVLDDEGEQLANFELNVVQHESKSIVIYKAGLRESYSCHPNCEVTLSVGDNPTYFEKMVSTQIAGKTSTAQSAAKLAE